MRKIRFEHGGKDLQFWAGHYGSKMSRASVVVKIPQEPLEPISTTLIDEFDEELVETVIPNVSATKSGYCENLLDDLD